MFLPGSADPVALDRAMREALADSLEHIHATVGARLNLPGPETLAAIAAVRSHRVAPGAFGRYYKTVLAIEDGDLVQARQRMIELVRMVRQEPRFTICVYADAALGDETALYGDIVNPDSNAPPWIAAPISADGFEQRVREALDLIDTADPALAGELRGLLIQVVGAAPSGASGAMAFGSVSSLMLWGLVVMNMERYATAADLVQGLVHEAAHLLLYAHSIDEPLVTNPLSERYKSPLRADPRPMDGIIHATFVSARMHYVNARLRAATSASFAPIPPKELDDRLATLRELYFGGVRTVREHGQLTATGRRILEESLDYMTAA